MKRRKNIHDIFGKWNRVAELQSSIVFNIVNDHDTPLEEIYVYYTYLGSNYYIGFGLDRQPLLN